MNYFYSFLYEMYKLREAMVAVVPLTICVTLEHSLINSAITVQHSRYIFSNCLLKIVWNGIINKQ